MIQVSRNSDQFPLRLPDGMRELIKEHAKANGRSMNSEIVFQLAKIFTQNEKGDVTA